MIIAEQLIKYKEYLVARSLSINYHNVIRIWLNYLQTKGLETFTQETITQFFTENNYKVNSKNHFIRAGRNYYNEFLSLPKENNEWSKVKLIKSERNIPNYIREEELDKVIAQMITHKSGRLMNSTKLKVLLHFCYYSGCRKQEILDLKRADFDLENNSARVNGKGSKQRIICFTSKVSKELLEYFAGEKEVTNAFNVTEKQLKYLPKIMAKYLGRNCYLHLLRHSFARNLLFNKGVDMNTVSKLLGHSSIATTMIYINPDEKTISDTYRNKVG